MLPPSIGCLHSLRSLPQLRSFAPSCSLPPLRSVTRTCFSLHCTSPSVALLPPLLFSLHCAFPSIALLPPSHSASILLLTPLCSPSIMPPLNLAPSLHCAPSLDHTSPSIRLLPLLCFSHHCCHCPSQLYSHPLLPRSLLSLVSAVLRSCHCYCCLLLPPLCCCH